MRTLNASIAGWIGAVPGERFTRWSRWSALAAAGLMFYDTAQLFIWINQGRVVAIPFFGWFRVTPVGAVVALAVWAVGMMALAHPRLRAGWGWLAAVGIAMCALMDRQTFVGSVLYVLVVATAMHWWSAWLAERPLLAEVRGAPLRVVQVLISVVFGWTALAKLNPRFMSGGVLGVSFAGPVAPPDVVLDGSWLVGLAIATVVAEMTFAVAIWIDTLRRWVVFAAVAFHLLIVLYFAPTLALVAFSLAMGSGYALFVAEPWASASDRDLDWPEESGSPRGTG